MNNIKVCILKESLAFGGNERSVANVTMTLENDYSVYLCLFNGQDVQFEYGGKLIDIKAPPKKTRLMKVINSFIRSFRVKRFVRREKIDIMYEFLSISNYLTYVKYEKLIKIISSRDFANLQNRICSYNKALKRSDGMIFNSEYAKSFYLGTYPEDKDKVFTVYNIIDTEKIEEQANEQTEETFNEFILNHPNTIISVGRFCKEKCYESLLMSFVFIQKQVKGAGLVLVGDGMYKDQYKLIIDKYNLQNDVYFTGFQKNPYKYMRKCRCFVLSSLSEGFPNVLAEAMAVGLPVISTNCFSGPAEILRKDALYVDLDKDFEQCDYGIMVPAIKDETEAAQHISKAVIHLLSNSELIEKYSAISKKRALDFSKKAALDSFKEIFSYLWSKKIIK